MRDDTDEQLHAMRTSLKALIDAANPAMLAALVKFPLGEAHSAELSIALKRAKATLEEDFKKNSSSARGNAGPRALEMAHRMAESQSFHGMETPPRTLLGRIASALQSRSRTA
jgi:hypothetical protein